MNKWIYAGILVAGLLVGLTCGFLLSNADTLMHHGLGDWVHKLYEDIKPTYEASGFVLRYLEIPNLQWLDDLNDCINISGTKKLTKLRIEVENYDPNRSLAESIFRSLHA
jgi:hypothetical protein